MRYLANGNTFENIAMVLGDEIGTLEKHYAELVPNDSQRLAFEKEFRKSAWISSEGTAQPEWLKRPSGSNSNRAMWSSPTNKGFGLDMGGGRWGVGQGCNCGPIQHAIATLIAAQRPDLAMVLIEQELNSQT